MGSIRPHVSACCVATVGHRPVAPLERPSVKASFRFLLARLSEISTYKGIVLGLTGLGVAVRPEVAAAVTSIGLGITGLIGIFFPDPTPTAE